MRDKYDANALQVKWGDILARKKDVFLSAFMEQPYFHERHQLDLLIKQHLVIFADLHPSRQTSKEVGRVQLHWEQNKYLPADTVESNQAK